MIQNLGRVQFTLIGDGTSTTVQVDIVEDPVQYAIPATGAWDNFADSRSNPISVESVQQSSGPTTVTATATVSGSKINLTFSSALQSGGEYSFIVNLLF